MKGVIWFMLTLVTTGAMAANDQRHAQLAPREHTKPFVIFLGTGKDGTVTRRYEGTRQFPIAYAEELEGGSIHAELNGSDVSALFHPPLIDERRRGDGGTEVVELPVVEGDNLLEITATPLGSDGLPDNDSAQIHQLTIHLTAKLSPRRHPEVTTQSSDNPADVEKFINQIPRHGNRKGGTM